MKLFDQDFDQWKPGDYFLTESEIDEGIMFSTYDEKVENKMYLVKYELLLNLVELPVFKIDKIDLQNQRVYFGSFTSKLENCYRINPLINKES